MRRTVELVGIHFMDKSLRLKRVEGKEKNLWEEMRRRECRTEEKESKSNLMKGRWK